MYDSLLFGNGLTLCVLNILKSLNLEFPAKRYLSFNSFLVDFLNADDSKRITRKFYDYFEITSDVYNNHKKTKEFLKLHKEEICSVGFERWVGRYLFSETVKIDGLKKTYLYVLYNYWYSIISTEIINKKTVVNVLGNLGTEIVSKIYNQENIYTLNFDNILDNWLKPQHLHGQFSLPFNNIEDIILNVYDKNKFEYTYLFGGNGFEKFYRLAKIKELKQDKYSLDFFCDKNLDLGHLLIYGISFSQSEILSDEFFKKFPEHASDYIMKSVDGHIIYKLNSLYNDKRIKKVTISYYSESDIENYNLIFKDIEINEIIEYKCCSEIFKI